MVSALFELLQHYRVALPFHLQGPHEGWPCARLQCKGITRRNPGAFRIRRASARSRIVFEREPGSGHDQGSPKSRVVSPEGKSMRAKTARQTMTGSDVVVGMLEARGTKYVFGVPGAKIDKVFDTLVDSPIQTVVCRHEQNAAFIAGGIGRMTGKAGVAIATSGPGVSNLVTGLATAHSEGDPMVALGGAVSVADRLKSLHQTMDSVSVCKPVTKYAAEVDSPASTAEVLATAFRAAESARPGSAFVSLPTDVMTGEAQCKPIGLSRFTEQGRAAEESLREAARRINSAKAPVVFLGLMASKPKAADAIHAFLNACSMPVVGTFQAAGAISQQLFPFFAGRVGQIANQPADEVLDTADLVLTIGYDAVEYWPSLWNKGRNRRIVHVDVVPAEIAKDYDPAVALLCAIHETLAALSPLVPRPTLNPPSH